MVRAPPSITPAIEAIIETSSSSVGDSGGNIVGNGGAGTLSLISILQPLANNGGSTFTRALSVGSLAINAGNNALAKNYAGAPLVNDQRGVGFPRIVGGTVDMGAFES